MRYIGNKTKILDEIDALLRDKDLFVKDLIFFDAFSGTASVAQKYKTLYKIFANDYLYYAYIWAEARLNSPSNMFEKLEVNPFVFFNEEHKLEGFVARNFAPKHAGRMYFNDENAQKIDYIRTTIDDWYEAGKIDKHEKYFLIASLIESLSKVANVAGVYGSYLKDWDSRAVKPMRFIPIDENPFVVQEAKIWNEDISTLITQIEGDILYLDPPYTKNQYSVQYHLLETIARNDEPQLSGKTGARNMSAYASDFSKQYKVNVVFENIIANARFKHIVFSYNSDGLMSKDFIEAVLKRYGKPETYEFRRKDYFRYKNARDEDKQNHCEYLFYVEKNFEPTYSSPLNYIGGKYDIIHFIKQNLPSNIDTFYDLFGGGANVAVNVDAMQIVYNDINFKVKDLLEYIANVDIAKFYQDISKKISKYGLAVANKEAYLKLRDDYNKTPHNKRSYEDLFLLVMFGFNQQIRFNTNLDYNNPVGMAGFNEKILEKLVSFSRITKQRKIQFLSKDYKFFAEQINKDDFVYLDPPYLITLGSYNDGKRGFTGWNEDEEMCLYKFIDNLNSRNIRFMLSNVLEHKGKRNEILASWLENSNYQVVEYQGKTRQDRKEIIVINY